MRGDDLVFPVSEYTEVPARSTHLNILLCRVELEADRGDMREVFEICSVFWEVVSKRRFSATKGEP